MNFNMTTENLECVRCGHKSQLSIASNGSNHIVSLELTCIECPPPPEPKRRRIGFGPWSRIKRIVARKKE